MTRAQQAADVRAIRASPSIHLPGCLCAECEPRTRAEPHALELLQALKELLRTNDEWRGSWNSDVAEARKNARAVIAKAEGRQP